MQFKSIFALSALASLAVASPGWKTSTKTWGATSTTKTWGTSSAPAPTSTGGFLNECLNFGISLLDCTQLANIAALNGNTISVGTSGGSTGGSSKPVNNGEQFLNACKNFGISVADCAQLLNIALLNGNTIDIDLPDLTSLLSSLGLSSLLPDLSSLLSGGLIPLPTNVI